MPPTQEYTTPQVCHPVVPSPASVACLARRLASRFAFRFFAASVLRGPDWVCLREVPLSSLPGVERGRSSMLSAEMVWGPWRDISCAQLSVD